MARIKQGAVLLDFSCRSCLLNLTLAQAATKARQQINTVVKPEPVHDVIPQPPSFSRLSNVMREAVDSSSTTWRKSSALIALRYLTSVSCLATSSAKKRQGETGDGMSLPATEICQLKSIAERNSQASEDGVKDGIELVSVETYIIRLLGLYLYTCFSYVYRPLYAIIYTKAT
ncbi:hypothetical protein OF83DRAFT_193962 [Amylostereum chailletii]|nr:hypothetical protein OF83DRAFT_193962 [Amylostereum chailletii]